MQAGSLAVRAIGALSLALLLASCGGGGGGGSSNSAGGPPTYSIGGTVSSTDGRPLGAGLVLQNNNGDNLAVPASATSFTFATSLASGAAYAVTVLGQPTNPAQTCTVTGGGTGTVGSANFSGVSISCTTKTYAITGTVSGLAGSGLVLRNNGGDDLPISTDGPFQFATPVASGDSFGVTVSTSPTNLSQTCTVAGGASGNGSGTVTNADVNVSITCNTNRFTVGGAVSLHNGTGLTLRVTTPSGTTDRFVAGNGNYAFPALLDGTSYTVTVSQQPVQQVCTVTNPNGNLAGANVNNVNINCATIAYSVGVTVSNLAGSGLVLRNTYGSNNLTSDLPIPQNGAFNFAALVEYNSPYKITVVSQPGNPAQTCTVSNDSGTVLGNVNLAVACTTNTTSIGGTFVNGHAPLGTNPILVLRNTYSSDGVNNLLVDDLTVPANSPAFTFNTPVPIGWHYGVSVLTQPGNPTQTCTVGNGSGIVPISAVTTVQISCTTNPYKIGGTVSVTGSGPLGTGGLKLHNGSEDLTISATGAFQFLTPVDSGKTYSVSITGQPTNPSQTCAFNPSGSFSGTVGGADVASVSIVCTANPYKIGGTVSVTGGGPLGTGGLTLHNGSEDLTISATGAFQFPTPVDSGKTYSVSITGQPSNPSQTCAFNPSGSSSGTVGGADVASVSIVCTANTYKIGGTVSVTGGGPLGTGGLKLHNGSEDLTISATGAFQFQTPVASGLTYSVSITGQPTNLSQTCAFNPSGSFSGAVGGADVASVSIVCTTNTFTIGGTVTAHNGTGLTLRLTTASGTTDLGVSGNGTFTFPAILDGTAYDVTVLSQPVQQVCTFGNNNSNHSGGTLAGANVANIAVNCATNTYTVGGTISVDGGTGSLGTTLKLRNAYDLGINTEDLTVSPGATSFTFTKQVAYNSDYSVSVPQDPSSPSQHCTVTANASGPVLAAVTNVVITCTTNPYKVGGTISGLTGTGLVLHNGSENLAVAANAPSFQFVNSVLSGAAYAVTATGPISNPTQTCTVTGGGAANNGSGTVGGADVTNVVVTCTTSSFTIGGTITGLTGAGLVLHNGSENLQVGTGANSFQFANSVLSGAAYAVTATGPISNPTQTCTVAGGGAANNGSGSVTDANVTNVVVTCTTSKFTIGGTVTGLVGTGLVLHNGSENLTVAANATGFQFVTPVASGAAYAVTATGPISNPTQTCTVTGGGAANNGSGTVADAAVANVVVTCTTSTFTIGGTISGLVGAGLKLKNNGGDDLTVAANATGFTFLTPVASGAAYAVTVSTQPSVPGQTCTVTGGGAANNGSGTVAAAAVTNVVITCVIPSPRFAYVPNAKENTVSIYAVNAQTGQLRNRGYVATGTDPRSVSIHPSGKFAYVANQVSSNVWVYQIDATTGALANPSIAAGPIGGGSYSVVVDPSGKFAYVTNFNSSSVSAYAIDSTTGALTLINCGGGASCASSDSTGFATGGGPQSIRIDPSGRFVYVANTNSSSISAYAIDASTGRLTPIDADLITAGIQAFPTASAPSWVTVDPSGRFVYVTNKVFPSTVSAYAIDPITGALTLIGSPVATDSGPGSVTVDPYGKFAYVTNYDFGTVSAYTITSSGPSAGALTRVDCGGGAGCSGPYFLVGPNPSSVSVDSLGKFAYVPSYNYDTISAFTINPTTGALTALPTLTGRHGNIVMAMTTGTTPVAYTPKFAYVAKSGGGVSAYTINSGTGVLTANGTAAPAGTSPASVSADPFGRFAYVVNSLSNDISAYTITGAGTLSQINCGGGGGCVGANFAAGTNPKSVTVDPSGRFAYVANAGDGVNPSTVSAYAIDSSTGALSPVAGSPYAAGTSPISVSLDASGRFAYVVNSVSNDISAYTIDAATGALTPIDRDPVTTPLVVDNFPAGTTPQAIGVDPFGRYAYVVNAGGTISAYTIDTRDPLVVTGVIPGALAAIGSPIATGTNPVSVTVDASGKFVYVANSGGGVSRYTIQSDGSLNSNGTTTAGTGPASVAVAASTGSTVSGSHEFAYVANSGAGTVSGFSVNDSSGVLTSVGAAVGAASTPSSVTTTGTVQ